MINMKGGVGKTTLATQIAWYATLRLDKKVLLVDLDPQANASQSVMSPQTYVSYLDGGGLTVADIFEQFTPTGTASGSPKKLDPLNRFPAACNAPTEACCTLYRHDLNFRGRCEIQPQKKRCFLASWPR